MYKNSAFALDRQLAEAGAHVVMAVRSTNRAQELIWKCQEEWSGKGLPLNIEVCCISFHSSIKYGQEVVHLFASLLPILRFQEFVSW